MNSPARERREALHLILTLLLAACATTPLTRSDTPGETDPAFTNFVSSQAGFRIRRGARKRGGSR